MEAIIFVGIQGSGKSTFYLQRFFATHVRINLDMLRTGHRERILLRACLEMKQPFVVDNTNPLIAERNVYISAARASQFRVIGYFFPTDLGAAIRRNEGRAGRQRIPTKGIIGTAKRLQPPTPEEGFDSLFEVKAGANGVFLVRDMLT